MKKRYFFILFLVFIGCEAVFVEDISNESVILLAPSESSTVSSGDITFRWQLVDQAELYSIQIVSPSFENVNQFVLDTVVSPVDSIQTSRSLTQDLDLGNYQWRVKALNSEYETQYSTVSFTVN
jgi:hypothetical protein